MKRPRRRSALLALCGLLVGLVPVLVATTPASAGTQTTTNACLSNATATYSDLPWTLVGEGTPDPITLGAGDITLSGSSVQVDIPATLLIAGYNLGLLNVGANNIPTLVYVARQANNVVGTGGVEVQVDNFNIVATTTITDPDATPGTGDETATPLAVNQPLPDMVVTPTGGNVTFSQGPNGSLPLLAPGVAGSGSVQPNGSIFASASVAGGLIRANFDCFPGTTVIDPPGGTSGPTFTPAASVTPFETVTVTAPPTAPVCTNETASVGVTQSATIDLNDNCTDVNEAQGGGSPFTFNVDDSALAGDLVATATPGVYTYTAPPTDPGAPEVISFTATDQTALTSSPASTVSITILANQCDATSAQCSLTQILVQPVVGTTMTLDKVPGPVVMSAVVLDGDAQVSTGALNTVTVTNARGTAAGWSLSGYTTDLGAPGGPTIDLTPLGRPGVVVPACTKRGAADILLPDDPASFDRLCIPGDNLGWAPDASIAHDIIHGDVADVDAGVAHATDAADWRSQLTAANSNLLTENGLGGLGEENVLCSAADEVSGGTFTCDADLFLGVPASAGAGQYTGGLVLTLL